MDRFTGKTVIVTGAAPCIGRGVAWLSASRGGVTVSRGQPAM